MLSLAGRCHTFDLDLLFVFLRSGAEGSAPAEPLAAAGGLMAVVDADLAQGEGVHPWAHAEGYVFICCLHQWLFRNLADCRSGPKIWEL